MQLNIYLKYSGTNETHFRINYVAEQRFFNEIPCSFDNILKTEVHYLDCFESSIICFFNNMHSAHHSKYHTLINELNMIKQQKLF